MPSLRCSRFVVVLTVYLCWPITAAYGGDVLFWDNYPDGIADATYNMSSERNTQVIEATWIVDDVDLAEVMPGEDLASIQITRLDWVGARHPDYSYGKADVILLDDSFNTLRYLPDIDYSFTDFDPDPNPAAQAQTFEGRVVFDPPISAGDLGEHFYIGVRLVADGYCRGRSYFVTSSIDSTLRGRTEGYTHGAIFGAPNWTPASTIWYGGNAPGINFEFAFRLYYSGPDCPGDLNSDGQIDLNDIALLLDNYGVADGADSADGDLDGDGDIDLLDLSLLISLYGTPCDDGA